MSIASLIYLSITAATAGFTGCATIVEFIEDRPIKWGWLALTFVSSAAVTFYIITKAT